MQGKKTKIFTCFCASLLLALSLQLPNRAVAVPTVQAAPTLAVGGQTAVIDPTESGEGYSAVLYDNTNGLPTSEANAIVETADGFIWIGSYSGLIRYDGDTFERLDSTGGIASVVSLFVDSKERLWIGTNDSGAAVMENGEFSIYNKAKGLKSSTIRSVIEGPDGSIYIATTRGIAVVNESMELSMLDEPQLNEEYIRVLRRGSDDIIYGVTNSGAVFTLYDGSLTGFYSSERMGIENIRAILPDPDNRGYVYIGTAQSEVYYGRLQNGLVSPTVIDIAPLEYVNAIDTVNGQIWVCADNGISVVKNGQSVRLKNIPVDSSAEGVMADYQGNLWFASSKQGVMKVVPNQFSDIFAQYDLPSTVVNTTCMYNDMLFIGTKNDGIIVVDENGRVESLPLESAVTASGERMEGAADLIQMLAGTRIRSIIRDSQNRVWISTYGENALLCYDNGSVTRFSSADGLPSDRVRAVCECADGAFLAVCQGGLTLIRDDEVTAVYDESSGISNTELLTAVETKNKDLMVGTDGDGIYAVRNGRVTHIGLEEGLSSEVVMRLKPDISRDITWIVTSNSIAYIDNNYQVTTVKNFPYSNNFDLYENSKGEMWILSSNGVYVAAVDELVANGELSTVYYGKDNGLSCITTSNSYSELTEDGDLYIAGSTGVAKVNIEQPFESVSDIKISIPYIEVDGHLTYTDASGKLTIPSGAKKLTIYSYVYNYSLMNPQVTYYLDGFDDTKTTVKRSELVPIDYTNLSGGTYRFVMQLADAQGRGNNEYAITIVKEKALHELLWFKVLCGAAGAVLIAGIVMLYIRRKTAALLEKEKRQKQLIREIVEAFAKVIDMKDAYTNGHSSRVAQYTVMLARELGYDEETVEEYYNIALLHDIGKVGVPPEVLNKPGKLTDEEFQIIKSHTTLGYNTLRGISIMPELAIGAWSHHERPDGKGYPQGLKGEEIPRVAQIIAVADTFDAMYSTRPYRKRMNFQKAVSIIKGVRGTQLTADVVDAFLRLVDKGEFRAPDDHGDGSTEDIDNIHKKQEKEKAEPVQVNEYSKKTTYDAARHQAMAGGEASYPIRFARERRDTE